MLEVVASFAIGDLEKTRTSSVLERLFCEALLRAREGLSELACFGREDAMLRTEDWLIYSAVSEVRHGAHCLPCSAMNRGWMIGGRSARSSRGGCLASLNSSESAAKKPWYEVLRFGKEE